MTQKQLVAICLSATILAASSSTTGAMTKELKDFKSRHIVMEPDDESERGAIVSIACARAISMASDRLVEKIGDVGRLYDVALCRKNSERIEVSLSSRKPELQAVWSIFADHDGRSLREIFRQR